MAAFYSLHVTRPLFPAEMDSIIEFPPDYQDILFPEEDRTPRVQLALEYRDNYLNFYIKHFTNYDPLPSACGRRLSRAVILVAIGLVSRTTWMGRQRAPTSHELSNALKFKTLSVPREEITIFNEFFSCEVKPEFLEKTIMRIQFCDVDKWNNEILIGECDLWPQAYVTTTFRELLIPQILYRPDLGELEVTMVYLPTAQRLCIDKINATNLKLDPNCQEIYIRIWLYTCNTFDEVHKTEHKIYQKDENSVYTFTKRLIFDLSRGYVMDAHSVMVVQAVEIVKEEKRVIGQFGISGNSPLCEQGLWRSVMKGCRKPITSVMRLFPGC